MAFSGVALCCMRVWRAASQREQLLAQYRIDRFHGKHGGGRPCEGEQFLNSVDLLGKECAHNGYNAEMACWA